mmetsp:Transcript_20107/g.41429  ORF Transcript_20107/g.41429 Transcript_20107/m.41429 type:complete len:98 (-) Transcript_20107:1799-2092(-)
MIRSFPHHRSTRRLFLLALDFLLPAFVDTERLLPLFLPLVVDENDPRVIEELLLGPLLRGTVACRLQPCSPSEILLLAGEMLKMSTPICCPINKLCN